MSQKPLIIQPSATKEQKIKILTAERNEKPSCCPFCESPLNVSIQQTRSFLDGKTHLGPCFKSFTCPSLKCQFAFEVTC